MVRLSPSHYSIADLDVAKHIYGPRTAYEKSAWYSAHRSPDKSYTIVTDQNNKHYAQIRRKYASSFSLSTVSQYEDSINHCLELLCKKLTSFASEQEECDFAHWLRLFSLDSICQITIGDLQIMELGKDRYRLLDNAGASTIYGNVVGRIPEWHPWIWKLIPGDKFEKGSINWIADTINKKSHGEFGGSKRTITFTDVWMQQEEKMSQEDVFLGIAASIGGGSDTSYTTIVNIIYLLGRHPQVLAKLQSEIDAAVKKDGLKNGMITYEAARGLPYLQAIIKESMRILPIVAVGLPRCVPAGGDTLSGYIFREGLTVSVDSWSTCKSPKYFGDDAEIFRPERWLGDSEEVKRNESYHMPFSIGPRSCIGRHIALMEISKAVSQLLHLFNFTVTVPSGELRYRSYSLIQPDVMRCRIELRRGGEHTNWRPF